jgi:hypothetical protein
MGLLADAGQLPLFLGIWISVPPVERQRSHKTYTLTFNFDAMIAAMLGKAFWAASGTGCQCSVPGRPLK